MTLHFFHLGQSRPNGLDVCLRCLGLCWQLVLALGSETLIPSSAHVSCPSTHTRWFVGMFDSVRLVTGSLDGGRGCGTLARAIYIHSFMTPLVDIMTPKHALIASFHKKLIVEDKAYSEAYNRTICLR